MGRSFLHLFQPSQQQGTRQGSHLCHPDSPNWCAVGVDGQGPFLNFSATPGGVLPPVIYTYRPRGLVANTVAQFGDGGIHAVDLFRSLFERWARTGMPGAGGTIFQPGPPVLNHWKKLCFFGGAVVIPMEVEIGSIMPGIAGGMPGLQIVVDATGSFEDYQFMFDPQ